MPQETLTRLTAESHGCLADGGPHLQQKQIWATAEGYGEIPAASILKTALTGFLIRFQQPGQGGLGCLPGR